MKEKISIIIPVYNAEQYIERCIDSCINQTYSNIEILIIDDGSKDKSLQKCNKYESVENVVIISKPNSGVSDTRNIGIEKSTGEYILFLDADDYIESDMCETMLMHMKDGIDMVVCGYITEDEHHICAVNKSDVIKNFNIKQKYELMLAMIEYSGYYVCWNKLYKKEKIVKNFPTGITFGEDSIFVSNYISNCTNTVIVPYVGYHYYVASVGSAMKRYHRGMFKMLVQEYQGIISIDEKNENIQRFASNHLFENLIYFTMPQLKNTRAISESTKMKEICELKALKDYKNAVDMYIPTNKTMAVYKKILAGKHFFVFYVFYLVEEMKRRMRR